MSTDSTKSDPVREAPPKGLVPPDELMMPGELVKRCLTEGDPMATREVPVLALALLSASMAETNKITDGLMEHYKNEAAQWKERALRAERGIRDVQQFHQLMCDPDYARRMMKMVSRSWAEDPPMEKDEFDDDGSR